MHAPSPDFPTQSQLVFPLLESVERAGGSLSARDAADALAERFAIAGPSRTRTVRTSDGQIVDLWRRHVRFSREKAKAMGYLTSDRRGGTWRLTDLGAQGLQRAQPAIVVEILTDRTGSAVGARINVVVGVPTTHALVRADARSLDFIADGEVPLIVTSCPYFDIKRYEHAPGQLAEAPSYDAFLEMLDDVWRECYRILTPGGRLCLNVGDVLRSRARHGEHHVLPLHADILSRSTRIGFRALTGILWAKPTNCGYEGGRGGVLGQPGQPNQIIKSEIEHILLLRKPGDYRSTSPAMRRDSAIGPDDHRRWFRAIWDDVPGASTRGAHPAPFPVEIPKRLVQMFSFRGDLVADVFAGSGTTAIACAETGRDSVMVDVSPSYLRTAAQRLRSLVAA
jgi:site-specific DNA-methyltransferase (adenine-specific)